MLRINEGKSYLWVRKRNQPRLTIALKSAYLFGPASPSWAGCDFTARRGVGALRSLGAVAVSLGARALGYLANQSGCLTFWGLSGSACTEVIRFVLVSEQAPQAALCGAGINSDAGSVLPCGSHRPHR